jgi:hypothetical protein
LALLFAPVALVGQDQAVETKITGTDFWRFQAQEKDFISDAAAVAIQGVYEIYYSDGKLRLFQAKGDQKEEIDWVSYQGGVFLAHLGRSKMFQDLKFPFSVGDKWKYEYKIRSRGSTRPVARIVEVAVTGIEEITTPAGKFRAFKLEKDDRAGARDFWLTTMYYSPQTKSVIKSRFDGTSGSGVGGIREIELIEYRSAK